MASTLTLERVRHDVEVLSRAGLDTTTFLAEVFESLGRAVPSEAACVASIDPGTRLTNGAFKFGALDGRTDTDGVFGRLEYGHPEPTSYAELARAGIRAVGMSLSSGGDVRRSPRVRELVQGCLDCTDELRLIATAGDQLWGGVAVFRDDRANPYSEEDVEFVASLSGSFARGLRVGIMARLAVDSDPPSPTVRPAVMVFDADGRLQQASVGADARLADLRSVPEPAMSEAIIASLVAAAWRYAAGDTDVLPAARLRLQSGRWIVLHASPLIGADGATMYVALTIEEARPPEILPLIAAAFDLTPRECDVTRLVLQGIDTREIAAELHVSRYTVQDHLKSIFNKTGVGSRRELVARIFLDQYVPRIGTVLLPSGSFSTPS